MVEPRLIYASKKGVYIGRPKIAYWSYPADMQSEGRFCMVGKGFILVYHKIDQDKIPTDHARPSEDHAWCRRSLTNGHMQLSGCIWLYRYHVWSNEPSS